jgi:hypothetical protein
VDLVHVIAHQQIKYETLISQILESTLLWISNIYIYIYIYIYILPMIDGVLSVGETDLLLIMISGP